MSVLSLDTLGFDPCLLFLKVGKSEFTTGAIAALKLICDRPYNGDSKLPRTCGADKLQARELLPTNARFFSPKGRRSSSNPYNLTYDHARTRHYHYPY
ncbi:hypothetical protein [Microseira wollei]|uniref:hypothetical protein n=1 Tax=Microseira wollei TaxID=467598 RepID=UPI001CFE4CC6|nr:hypothetical protein [Microseira wollei]